LYASQFISKLKTVAKIQYSFSKGSNEPYNNEISLSLKNTTQNFSLSLNNSSFKRLLINYEGSLFKSKFINDNVYLKTYLRLQSFAELNYEISKYHSLKTQILNSVWKEPENNKANLFNISYTYTKSSKKIELGIACNNLFNSKNVFSFNQMQNIIHEQWIAIRPRQIMFLLQYAL